MKVSIIIPTYNEAGFIGECIHSLATQTYNNIEIIIVDDGSTDETIKILSGLKNDLHFTLLTQFHKGAGAARNKGATTANGKILIFVDADMTFDKKFVEKLIAPILKDNEIGTFSKEEYVSNWNNIWARCWNWNLDLPDKHRLPANYPNTQKVFRAILKKKFDEVKGFTPGGYTDDWSLSTKIGTEAVVANGAIFFHRNPERLIEVYRQARWVAKRPYKLGWIGFVIGLARHTLPISLLDGVYKSVIHHDVRFVVFKCVFDLGSTFGILSYAFTKRGSK